MLGFELFQVSQGTYPVQEGTAWRHAEKQLLVSKQADIKGNTACPRIGTTVLPPSLRLYHGRASRGCVRFIHPLSCTAHRINIINSHGSILIGTVINILLFGIMIAQVYIYYTSYRR